MAIVVFCLIFHCWKAISIFSLSLLYYIFQKLPQKNNICIAPKFLYFPVFEIAHQFKKNDNSGLKLYATKQSYQSKQERVRVKVKVMPIKCWFVLMPIGYIYFSAVLYFNDMAHQCVCCCCLCVCVALSYIVLYFILFLLLFFH